MKIIYVSLVALLSGCYATAPTNWTDRQCLSEVQQRTSSCVSCCRGDDPHQTCVSDYFLAPLPRFECQRVNEYSED